MKVGDKTETVLKNATGLTLYYFTPDTATTIACTGGCASNWPPHTYVKDGDAGDAYGQGVGGKWFVATPDLAAAATASPALPRYSP